MKSISIAIDGPSGAGKSTLAKELSAILGYLYVDTGAIYRTIGYYALTHGIDPTDEAAVVAALPDISIRLSYGEDGIQHMYLNDQDVTSEIRLPDVSRYASDASAHPGVRAFLLEMQRRLARENSVIMDGRDIGTVVLPKANAKIFLTASAEVRAKRRTDELIAKGQKANYEQILKEIKQRDHQDTTRPIAPLKQAKDAVLLDTSEMTIAEVIAAMKRIIGEKIPV